MRQKKPRLLAGPVRFWSLRSQGIALALKNELLNNQFNYL